MQTCLAHVKETEGSTETYQEDRREEHHFILFRRCSRLQTTTVRALRSMPGGGAGDPPGLGLKGDGNVSKHGNSKQLSGLSLSKA